MWDCAVRSLRSLREPLKEPLKGPVVVPVYTAEARDEALSWASASPPPVPVTCADFVSDPMQAGADKKAFPVLVTSASSSGPSVRHALLHDLSANGVQGPRPLDLACSKEFDDDVSTDQTVAKWVVFRLTLAKRYCDAERFAAASKKPVSLPNLLLPATASRTVVRTYAVAAYDAEVTCLVRVREGDATSFAQCARQLPAGGFLAYQRNPLQAVTWFQRSPGLSDEGFYKEAVASLAKAPASCCLAYRSGGLNNLGLRGSPADTKTFGQDSASVIAPRWQLTSAPATWVVSDAEAWLQLHGFKGAYNVQRAGSRAWTFCAWSSHPTPGPKVFSSGIAVAPAANRQRRKKPQACSTSTPVWGVASLPKHAPVPASVPPTFAPASVQPTAALASTQLDSSQQLEAQPDAEMVSPESASVGAAKRGSSELAVSAAKAPKASPVPRPAMPFADSFRSVETGGQGDCAYTSVATALAKLGRTDAQPGDLQPAGRLQGYLRCEAAKWVRGHAADFGGPEKAGRLATALSTQGTWADTPSLYALSKALKIQLRIFAFCNTSNLWRQYVVGDSPSSPPPKKQKPNAKVSVVWLELTDQHYRWLEPLASDQHVEQAVLPTAVRVATPAAFSGLATLGGGGRSSGSQASSNTPRRLLGLCGSSVATSSARKGSKVSGPAASVSQGVKGPSKRALSGCNRGGGSCAKLLGLKSSSSSVAQTASNPGSAKRARSTASCAASSAQLLGLRQPARDSDLSDSPYSRGDLFKCACGWTPPLAASSSVSKNAAVQHWRACQGIRPPSQTAQDVRRRVALSGMLSPEARQAKAAAALKAYRRFVSKLKAKKWTSAACELLEDTPFIVFSVNAKSPRCSTAYQCAKCGRVAHLGVFREFPCKARPAGISVYQWRLKTRGRKAAEAFAAGGRARYLKKRDARAALSS